MEIKKANAQQYSPDEGSQLAEQSLFSFFAGILRVFVFMF
jgi:hypothetical protein